VGELRYFPHGKTRYTDGTTPTSRRFTGQVEDATIGLYFMYARYYDPALGRWIQPDSIVPRPSNPQEFNRYSWVINNPIKYIDPDGHQVQAAVGALVLVGGTATPWPDDVATIPIGLALVASDPLVQQLMVQSDMYLPQISAMTDQAARNLGEVARRVGEKISSNSSSSSSPPEDPFRDAPEKVRRGVETLRRTINNVRTWTTGRYGAQAHLSRAEYYQQQGTLQSVNPTGSGSIDLVLNNNTGVEVKYWTSQRVADDIRILANQFSGFNNLGLDQITVEFVQTQGKPVTTETLVWFKNN
jgi:RHS repeat-associated protein